MRGAFIVLEGVDRCGKTTQCRRLMETLTSAGVPCEALRFPDRTTLTGKLIDSYLQQGVELDDQAVHLLFSANRWEAAASIHEKLAQGKTLVVDRYAYSGACFTAAKGVDLSWCKAPDAGLPAPDMVLFLDLPVEKAKLRGEFGMERYEKEAFQVKVRTCFLELGKTDANWTAVDADQTVDALAKALGAKAMECVQRVKKEPVRKLYMHTTF
jgi:dTMP kinase